MIFSWLGRFLSRCSRSKNLISQNGQSTAALNSNEGLLGVLGSGSGSYLGWVNGDLEFMRSYIATTIGPQKTHVSDLDYILGNPKLLRLFSSETPKKKNFENFYPKEKKEILKGDDQKSDSKGAK